MRQQLHTRMQDQHAQVLRGDDVLYDVVQKRPGIIQIVQYAEPPLSKQLPHVAYRELAAIILPGTWEQHWLTCPALQQQTATGEMMHSGKLLQWEAHIVRQLDNNLLLSDNILGGQQTMTIPHQHTKPLVNLLTKYAWLQFAQPQAPAAEQQPLEWTLLHPRNISLST